MKRIVLAADFHCGNRVGLTPPAWQDSPETGPEGMRKYAMFQREVWNFWASELAALQPIDCLFFLGDGVDGKGERSGGTEEIQMDRIKQAQMADRCIREVQAPEVYMVYGTPYHVGADEDWEDLVAAFVGCSISGREFVEVEGLVFDLAHFVGGSSVPYSRSTAALRDMVWNMIWAHDGKQPDADYIVRGHVHHSVYHEEYGKVVEILPALQGYGSKFGIRKCRATVEIGFTHLDVEDGRVTRCPHMLKSDLLRIEPKRPFESPTSMETSLRSDE
jgi:hypothetical protein